jgi:dipeptidyl aminopeptidase/acylaminoacyl peptidase
VVRPPLLSSNKNLATMSFTHLCIAHALLASLFASTTVAQPADIWNFDEWHLWRIEIDGSGLKPLDQTPGNRCGSPVWSPDGKLLVYDITDASISPRIVVIQSDGSRRRVLGHGSTPCWSPDGKLIAFGLGGRAFMNPDGRGIEVFPGPPWGMRWPARSNTIFSLDIEDPTSFKLFNLRTDKEIEIPANGYPIYHGFDVSSDGLKVCFGSVHAGLCVATLDPQAGTATIEPLVKSGRGFHASWSPDETQIVFAWQQSPPSGLIQIYTYDTKSGGTPSLLPGLDLSHHNVNPAWSPDGRTIAFSCPPTR